MPSLASQRSNDFFSEGLPPVMTTMCPSARGTGSAPGIADEDPGRLRQSSLRAAAAAVPRARNRLRSNHLHMPLEMKTLTIVATRVAVSLGFSGSSAPLCAAHLALR